MSAEDEMRDRLRQITEQMVKEMRQQVAEALPAGADPGSILDRTRAMFLEAFDRAEEQAVRPPYGLGRDNRSEDSQAD